MYASGVLTWSFNRHVVLKWEGYIDVLEWTQVKASMQYKKDWSCIIDSE
jgi:hypothetical protein